MRESCILRWFLALLRKERTGTKKDEKKMRDSYKSICENLAQENETQKNEIRKTKKTYKQEK